MKRKIFALTILLLTVFSLSGCHRVTGNQMDFDYLHEELEFVDGIGEVFNGRGSIFHIDCNQKVLTVTDYHDYEYKEPAVEGGNTFRAPFHAEGYEGIEDNIMRLKTNRKSSVMYTQGYLLGGEILGLCNVYDDTVGYLSGGGCYAEEEINHSVYYRYTAEDDSFEVLAKMDDALALAFSGRKVVYWKNRKLYGFDIDSKREVFICKDYSYDFGIQHQSRGTVYFNGEYAILCFNKAWLNNRNDCYAFLYSFATDEVIELECRGDLMIF